MKILIVEDEALAAKKLRKMVEENQPDAVVAGMTDSIESTVDWLNKEEHPDVILMDIELADGQSFEIFNRVEVRSTIIFTTAYDEYALRAFKVNSIDYLLKPVDADELRRAFQKLKDRNAAPEIKSSSKIDLDSIMQAIQHKTMPSYKKRFLVKQGQRLISVDISEIAFFYTEDKVSFIRSFTDQRYMVDHSLDELEELLDPEHFFRANRQFIVSVKSLDGIHHHFNGKLKINLKPVAGDDVFVSRERASDFKSWLGEA
jgi:two-component system LytT family response regulator